MQRFRAFNSAAWGDDVGQMESAINAWLEADHPHIHMMAQSSFGEHLIVSFIYAESFQMTATAEEAAAVAEHFERSLETTNPNSSSEIIVTLPLVELPY